MPYKITHIGNFCTLLCIGMGFFSVTETKIDAKPLPKAQIRILKIVEHPALNETVKGIIAQLNAKGYTDIKVESAQGQPALAGQIAARFSSEAEGKKNYITVALGTVAAQSLMKYAKKDIFPLIFSSITDPLGAGLVKDMKKPQWGASGVSNFIPLIPQLEFFIKIQPTLKKLGFPYNPGEANAVSILKELKKACAKLGIQLIPQALIKTADARQVISKLAPQVDAIFVSNDNTALSALPAIVKAADSVPVYVSDTDAVMPSGALASLGPNQYAIGEQTGHMIIQALEGTDVNMLPVQFPEKTTIVINKNAANRLKMNIPDHKDLTAPAKR